MYKFIVITDPESGDGFRLAGATVLEASTPEDAGREIAEILNNDDEAGIVAVREDYMACLDTTLLSRIERCYHPVIIPIPALQKEAGMGNYIEMLLKRAIGYNVVVR